MKMLKGFAILLIGVVLLVFITAAVLWQLCWGSFTPIRFYGNVVDTDGHPVPEAQVHVSFAEMPYADGVRDDTTSDENGNFSVIGHGAGIDVMVSKSGYYVLPQSDGNFQTWPPGTTQTWPEGAGDYWRSSSSNPIIFKLLKMGVCEPLIEYGTNYKYARDGTPITIDLSEGRAYRLLNEDLQVQTWVDDQGLAPGAYRRYDWRFKVLVPGGGLQPRTGEFDFHAPMDGYVPSDEVDVSASDPKWSSQATREYFLKLASGKYARIKFFMAAGGDHFFSITSYINPQPGHRDLEFDPAQQINK